MSEHLSVERVGGEGVVVRDAASGCCMRLGRDLYAFVRRFEQPRSLEELGLGAHPEARRFLDQMLERGFLRHADAPAAEPLTRATGQRLFGVPADEPGHAADVAFLGVPFDGGSTAGPGARGGPRALRTSSQEMPHGYDPETCRSRGWFDEDKGGWILRGAVLADRGDVVVRPGDSPARVFDRVTAAVAELLRRGTLPVVLGGDHSITHPVVRAYAGRPLAILHLDAHTDCSPWSEGAEHHHGNVFSRLLTLPDVTHLVQVGVRGFLSRDAAVIGDARRQGITPSLLRRAGAAAVVDRIPPGQPVYVSIDIDVLDPSQAPGTAAPRPNGLTLAEARDVVERVAREREVVGIDLVEVNPEHDVNRMTALAAVELILGLLGAVAARRARSEERTC